jgi:hypothetical protein
VLVMLGVFFLVWVQLVRVFRLPLCSALHRYSFAYGLAWVKAAAFKNAHTTAATDRLSSPVLGSTAVAHMRPSPDSMASLTCHASVGLLYTPYHDLQQVGHVIVAASELQLTPAGLT